MLRYKYNPQNASQEELQATFTAREMMLSRLLNELKHEIDKKSNQHYLVIGARGIGKTNFLRMIYFGVNDDRQLNKKWLPLQFAEEEYSINSLRDFLVKILDILSEEAHKPEIGETAERLRENEDDDAVVASAVSYLEDYTTTTGKRLIILVDNLDLILGDQWKAKSEIKRLRDIMMNKNFLKIIAASPTYFKEVSKYTEPFYNFFKTINLEELTDEQIEELLKKRATFEGNTKLLERLPIERPKLRAIRHLTGGNPRLVLMLYELFAISDLKQVKDYLQSLLDDLTPYYQYKLKWLSPQQRTIIDGMAQLDKAASPTEIAKATRLHVNIVSTNLKRLMDWGYVKLPEQAKRKATYYIISERLFRLWHQMRISRSARKKIELFVEFIQIWYSLDELVSEAERLTNMFQDYVSHKDVDRAKSAIEHLDYLASASTDEALRDVLKDMAIQMLQELGDFDHAEKKLNEIVAECKQNNNKERSSRSYLALAKIRVRKNDYSESIQLFNKATEMDPRLYDAWFARGLAEIELKDFDAALRSFDEVLKIKPDFVKALEGRGLILSYFERLEEAIGCFDRVVELQPDNGAFWQHRAAALRQLKRYDEALKSYDKALEFLPGSFDAWFNRGLTCSDLHYIEEAKNSYDQALKLKPNHMDALNRSGLILLMMGQPEEATDNFRKALQQSKTQQDIQAASMLLVVGYLVASSQNISNKNTDVGRQQYSASLPFFKTITAKRPREIINSSLVTFFQSVISEVSIPIVKDLLDIAGKELMEEAGLVAPFAIVIEYLEKNRDPEILDRLNPEVREVVEDIIKKADEARKTKPAS